MPLSASLIRYSRILREGTRSTSLFVLLSGHIAVYNAKSGETPTRTPTSLGRGALCDEACLVAEVARETSVSAITPCHVLVIERSALVWNEPTELDPRRVLRAPPMAALTTTPEFHELRISVIAGMLEALAFFRSLTHGRRAAVAALLEVATYEVGEVVFEQVASVP